MSYKLINTEEDELKFGALTVFYPRNPFLELFLSNLTISEMKGAKDCCKLLFWCILHLVELSF